MNTSRISIALFGAAVLCASAVLAGEVNKLTIKTEETLNVDGKSLSPGNYKVEWNGSGPNVQVKMMQGKDTVATFPANLEQQKAQNPENAYASMKEPDGTRSLTTIYVGGKRDVLQVQPENPFCARIAGLAC